MTAPTHPPGLGAVAEVVLGYAAGGDAQPPATVAALVGHPVKVDPVGGQPLDDAQVPEERRTTESDARLEVSEK